VWRSYRGLLVKYEDGSKLLLISRFTYTPESWVQDKVRFDVLTAVFMRNQVF